MKRYVLLLSLSLGSLVQMHAQSLEECRSEWNESSANVSDNIRYTSLNPSRISFNSYKNKGVAKLDYTIGRGSYRPVDEGRQSNHLKFYMGGIKNRRVGLHQLPQFTRERQEVELHPFSQPR